MKNHGRLQFARHFFPKFTLFTFSWFVLIFRYSIAPRRFFLILLRHLLSFDAFDSFAAGLSLSPELSPLIAMSVCVILSGCGVYDGSEVHEASAVCVGLARKGKKIVFFAPNKNQHHAINHLNGASDPQGDNKYPRLILQGSCILYFALLFFRAKCNGGIEQDCPWSRFGSEGSHPPFLSIICRF